MSEESAHTVMTIQFTKGTKENYNFTSFEAAKAAAADWVVALREVPAGVWLFDGAGMIDMPVECLIGIRADFVERVTLWPYLNRRTPRTPS